MFGPERPVSYHVDQTRRRYIEPTPSRFETYTIREHLGDVVTQLPGGLSIKREAQDVERDGEMYRVPGETIQINGTELIGVIRTIRLERRERVTVEQMLKMPGVRETEEKLARHNREMREK